MYRSLLMFPKSAAAADVDRLIEGMAASFRASPGFLAITRNAGALMGPGAHAGDVGSILEADFASLEDVFAALESESFREVRAETESLGTTIFLFESASV